MGKHGRNGGGGGGGGRGGRGGGRGGRGGKKARADHPEGQRGDWAPLKVDNAHFDEYYKNNGIVASADEFAAMRQTLQKPLPSVLRINQLSPFAPYIEARLTSSPGTHALSWSPHAYRFDYSRQELRSDDNLKALHRFITAHNDAGSVSRQEAVSMIPVLCLDVRPGMKCLDMCAAPGSKTGQIIEALGIDPNDDGLVVANDIDEKRCYMLVHQSGRFGSPKCMVTNHEAQHFPQPPFLFDRVLADVPCSGDGTLRKNPDLWGKWTTALGMGLHRLQLAIALRGVRLTAVGGRFVYSTCSLNPVEDEAVVLEILRRTKGAVRLLDMSASLVGLKRHPGLGTWRLMDKGSAPYTWYSDFAAVPESRRQQICASMFPGSAPEEAELRAQLRHCMRVLPHLQDSGGFFVAVFEKVAAWPPARPAAAAAGADDVADEEKVVVPAEAQAAAAEASGGDGDAGGGGGGGEEVEPIEAAGKRDGPAPMEEDNDAVPEVRKSKEAPFLPLSPALTALVERAKAFYCINDKFPFAQLMARSPTAPKIYLVAKSSPAMIAALGPRLRLVNTGIRVFIKHDAPGSTIELRLANDAAEILHACMDSKRQIELAPEEFRHIVKQKDTQFKLFSERVQAALAAIGASRCVGG